VSFDTTLKYGGAVDMKEKKRNKPLLYLMGFLCGRAYVCGINPFIVPFLISALYIRENAFVTIICMLLGMISCVLLPPEAVEGNNGANNSVFMENQASIYILKYVIMIVAVITVINTVRVVHKNKYKNRKYKPSGKYMIWNGREYELVWLAVVTYVVSLLFGYNTYTGYMLYLMPFCEMIISICFVPLFYTGLNVLVKYVEERDRFNEELLGVLAVTAMCLWGMPVTLYDRIPFLMIVGMAVCWYTLHRFNAGYGVAVTGVCSVIMAVRTDLPELVGAMFIVAVIVMAGKIISDRRKMGTFTSGLIACLLTGSIYFDYFLTIDGLTAIGGSLIIFALIPRNLLSIKDDMIYNKYNIRAATEINRITAEKIRSLSGAFKRIEYTLAGCGPSTARVSLGEIGDMIGRFSDNLENAEVIPVNQEDRLRDILSEQGVILTHMTSVKNEMNHRQYYITARTKHKKIMLSKDVADIMSDVLKQPVRVAEDTPAILTENDRVIAFEENAGYRCSYYVRRIKKYGSNVSGDNFSVKEHEDGRLVMMISDGMGSGSIASCESTLMIDTMEEMMEAGFDPSYGIAFSNECISEKNNGCSFTTFDMGVVNLYDGSFTVYKQGAAATYIVHNNGLENTSDYSKKEKHDVLQADKKDSKEHIEILHGTTLPIGVLPKAECDVIETKLEDDDIIVMASDGIMDEDDFMKNVLSNIHSDNCKDILDDIITDLLCKCGGRLRDDVTIIVARIEEMLYT
jgi:stage II sporulation protein E